MWHATSLSAESHHAINLLPLQSILPLHLTKIQSNIRRQHSIVLLMRRQQTKATNIDSPNSSTTAPDDSRRKRIDGRLLGIGDTVFIIQFGYNGTIIDFRGKQVLVLPHNYSYLIFLPVSKLRVGRGINCHQRLHLDQLAVYYFDQCILHTGTYPASHRR